MLIFLFNVGSVWNHVISSAPLSKSVVLDFVGMGTFAPPLTLFFYSYKRYTTAFTPPRTQLLLLDLLIIALSVIVTTVAYETAYARAVTKAAIRATLDLTPTAPSPAQTYFDPLDLGGGNGNDDDPDDMVLNLRASLLLRHVRRPPAPPPDDAPLPNGATIVEGLRVLLQAQRSFRARQQTPPAAGGGDDEAQMPAEERERERRVPGGMDPPEDS
jgi:hypothetical protein